MASVSGVKRPNRVRLPFEEQEWNLRPLLFGIPSGETDGFSSLSLGEDVPTGRCSFVENDFSCNVGLVEASGAPATDESEEWGVLVLSGARYVFSHLNIPHKTLIVHQLEGCLDEEDTLPIAHASAMCLLTLLGVDATQVKTEGWHLET
jgi:hypothetical protein